MRALPVLLATAALFVVPSPAPAQDHPDLTGKWKFDPTQSSGTVTPPPRIGRVQPTRNSPRRGSTTRGRGATPTIEDAVPSTEPDELEQELSIKFDKDKGILQVEQVTNGIKETFRYPVDGAEQENEYYFPRAQQAVKLKTTTRWDGPKLVTEASGSARTDQGTVLYTASETRYLGPEGTTLVVESQVSTTGGRAVQRRLVYVKQ